MDKSSLCDDWQDALAGWAIPDGIIRSAAKSPWILHPEKFAPSSDRMLTPTIRKIREFLAAVRETDLSSLIDVGCGAGGVSLLLLDLVDSLIVVDESRPMLTALRNNLDDSVTEIDLKTIEGRWPEKAIDAGTAAVVICANVLYNVARPCEFIEALDAAATSTVVIEIHEEHPHSEANAAWKYFWNIERPTGPCGADLLNIIEEMGYAPETTTFYRDSPGDRPLDDDLLHSIAQRICLDSSREDDLREFLISNPVQRQQFRTIWWEK